MKNGNSLDHYGRLVLAAIMAVSAVGCDSSKDRTKIERQCAMNKVWLDLTDAEENDCLNNKNVRIDLTRRRLEAMAKAMAKAFNSEKGILEVADSESETYAFIASLTQLNDELSAADEGRSFGQRYKVRVRLGWSQPVDRYSERTVSLSDLNPYANRSTTEAHLNYLNEHQKRFLEKHCWLPEIASDSTLCEGEALLSRDKDVDGILINLELRGISFDVAEESHVIKALTRSLIGPSVPPP